jgi:hypothetical protein
MGHYPIDAPTQRYGYAVMYIDGEDMGEYVGYFQDSLNTAKSVADELMSNHADAASAAGVGATPIGIYELVLVETVHPPKGDDDDDF